MFRFALASHHLDEELLHALAPPFGQDDLFVTLRQIGAEDPLVHDKSSLGLAKAGFSAIDVCFARAKELTPPLLIMHGKADRGTYASGSVEFAKLAGATNKDVTLKLWEGMYHELHNEPEQAEVFKVMIEWLDRHL